VFENADARKRARCRLLALRVTSLPRSIAVAFGERSGREPIGTTDAAGRE